MKIANVMNFVRTFEPRNVALEAKMVEATRDQLRMVNEMGVDATFLLEYDALKDETYLEIFRNGAGENIELGLWYEIVEPLTTDIGIEYKSAMGYKWDWNIEPGYPMSYDVQTRERLIDRAMQTFRETFGYFPRTVGSWALDTHTVNYLAEHYDIDAMCICRDQINTDAYTLIGGYFNGMYYPSKKNAFTPASTEENRVCVPMIRLLGPDPIHNYDTKKQLSEQRRQVVDKDLSEPLSSCFTLEPGCKAGCDPKSVDWFFDCFFGDDILSHGYVQIGQENSFAMFDIVEPVRMQLKKLLKRGDVKIMKMCDTGRLFREKFNTTPAAAVNAVENWDTVDCQSSVYSSAHYTANILRKGDTVALRYLYLFDENIEDKYLNAKCSTFDCVYENLPVVDTYPQRGETDGGEGIVLTRGCSSIEACADGEDVLNVKWDGGSVEFRPDRIVTHKCKLSFAPKMVRTKISIDQNNIAYEYNGYKYYLNIIGGVLSFDGETFEISGDEVTLVPRCGGKI